MSMYWTPRLLFWIFLVHATLATTHLFCRILLLCEHLTFLPHNTYFRPGKGHKEVPNCITWFRLFQSSLCLQFHRQTDDAHATEILRNPSQLALSLIVAGLTSIHRAEYVTSKTTRVITLTQTITARTSRTSSPTTSAWRIVIDVSQRHPLYPLPFSHIRLQRE